MNEQELAEARSRGYGLLARLLVEGPTPALLARAAETPLAEAMGDADGLAASHYALFQLEVFPYVGLFLDDSGLLGGETAAAFEGHCRDAGFGASPDVASADHLGAVAGLLAFLTGAEADALADGQAEAVASARRRALDTLDRWLLSWLLPFHAAAADAGEPFWVGVLDMLAALAVSHRAALGGAITAVELPVPPADLLERRQTGLKAIAGYLLTPAHSGVWLSRQDIAALARGRDTPRGFGGRLQMLTNLLRNAAEYDDLPGLVGALDLLLTARVGNPHALPEAHVAPWADRVAATRALLATVAAAA